MEKKLRWKRVEKNLMDAAVNVFLYIITCTDQKLSDGLKESQNNREKSSNKNKVSNKTKFNTGMMHVNVVDRILQSTWCTFDIMIPSIVTIPIHELVTLFLEFCTYIAMAAKFISINLIEMKFNLISSEKCFLVNLKLDKNHDIMEILSL